MIINVNQFVFGVGKPRFVLLTLHFELPLQKRFSLARLPFNLGQLRCARARVNRQQEFFIRWRYPVQRKFCAVA